MINSTRACFPMLQLVLKAFEYPTCGSSITPLEILSSGGVPAPLCRTFQVLYTLARCVDNRSWHHPPTRVPF